MLVEIPYGDESVAVDIPGARLLGVLKPGRAPVVAPGAVVRRAAASPQGQRTLRDFAAAGEPVLVLVNDATRPTPTAGMLAAVWDDIAAWDLSFLIATGTHRAPSEAELARIFGGLWPRVRGRVRVHDARDEAGLALAGTTSAGTEVSLNRAVMEARRILVIGSVETHYFAGYTGGRKIVLPGIAGYRTIEQNHALALDSRSTALALAGNPVHEDMDEALGFLLGRPGAELFALLAVLDRDKRICFAAAGGIREAFRAAVAEVDTLFAAPAKEKAGVVIAVAEPPLDIDFYQAQKAVENGAMILEDGGILLVISACRTGVGNEAFLRLMRQAGSPGAVIAAARADYHLGYHKASRLAAVAARAEMWAVAGVDHAVVQAAFMRPFADVGEAVATALAARPESGVWVLMDAGETVPRLG